MDATATRTQKGRFCVGISAKILYQIFSRYLIGCELGIPWRQQLRPPILGIFREFSQVRWARGVYLNCMLYIIRSWICFYKRGSSKRTSSRENCDVTWPRPCTIFDDVMISEPGSKVHKHRWQSKKFSLWFKFDDLCCSYKRISP